MNKLGYTQKHLRKRKMMIVFPLLVIPFITMAFWSLGGGKTKQTSTQISSGLNINLPNPILKDDKQSDKLIFYDQAERDSLKLEELMRNDPYYKQIIDKGIGTTSELKKITESSSSKFNQRLNTSLYDHPVENPEDKLLQRLRDIESEISKSSNEKKVLPEKGSTIPSVSSDGELSKLNAMIKDLSTNGSDDPEMVQLDKTLDKILDIQHPERVKKEVINKPLPENKSILPVNTKEYRGKISLLCNVPEDTQQNGTFFGGVSTDTPKRTSNSIDAVIHENQLLVNGSIIKLRLVTGITVNNVSIAKGSFLFGVTRFGDERVNVEINSIRFMDLLYPVKLILYDLDGLPGIYIPGAISRDAFKQSVDNSLQLMELSTMDPSLKAQAATAGINSLKGLMSKKVKQIKVYVKAGYRVSLMDTKYNQ